MSESPYNPVAPALANAIARACGARVRRPADDAGAGVADAVGLGVGSMTINVALHAG